jgi:hypothetical protein
LNNWYFEPIYHYKNSVHLTGHVHNKFEINDIIGKENNKIILPLIDPNKILISKLKLNKNKVETRLVNLRGKIISEKVLINNTQEVHFNKYEYKNI